MLSYKETCIFYILEWMNQNISRVTNLNEDLSDLILEPLEADGTLEYDREAAFEHLANWRVETGLFLEMCKDSSVHLNPFLDPERTQLAMVGYGIRQLVESVLNGLEIGTGIVISKELIVSFEKSLNMIEDIEFN